MSACTWSSCASSERNLFLGADPSRSARPWLPRNASTSAIRHPCGASTRRPTSRQRSSACPCCSVQLANQIPALPAKQPIISLPLSTYTVNPGLGLGLAYDDIDLNFNLVQVTHVLTHVNSGSQIVATYFTGADGALTNPAEPTLPLRVENVTVDGMVLRGVGFRGGSFQDIADILPLTGAPATEIRGVHTPFEFRCAFFPIRPWGVNYFGALYSPVGGTRLGVTPVQHKSTSSGSQTSILRRFSDMQFRLFYSGHTATAPDGTLPAKSDAPTIVRVGAVAGASSIALRAAVVGNPAVGIQEVWATYYIEGSPSPEWKSIDLVQSPADSRVWVGTLPLNGADAGDFRFIVQAVNGVGLVSASTNFGEYFSLKGIDPPANRDPVSIDLVLETDHWSYGGHAWPSLNEIRCGETLLSGANIEFSLGSVTVRATTGDYGEAWAEIPLLNRPGVYKVTASFEGDDQCAPASASLPFTITKAATQIDLQPVPAGQVALIPPRAPVGAARVMTATLTDQNYSGEEYLANPLNNKTVVFVLESQGPPPVTKYQTSATTDFAGRAYLSGVSPATGTYTVTAYYLGQIPLIGGPLFLDSPIYEPSIATGSIAFYDGPQALDNTYWFSASVELDGSVFGNVLIDSPADVAGHYGPVFVEQISSPQQGWFEQFYTDGTIYYYCPAGDCPASAKAKYRITDTLGWSSVATIYLFNSTPY